MNWNLIDRKGKEVLGREYDFLAVNDSSSAVFRCSEGGYGVLALRDESILIPPDFSEVAPLSFDRYVVTRDDCCGILSRDGEVIKWGFDTLSYFSCKCAVAFAGEKAGLVNLDGEYVIPPRYDYMEDASEDVVAARKDWHYAYFSNQGQQLTDFEFEEAGPFRESLAFVQKSGKWKIIDRNFQTVSEDLGRWQRGFFFSENIAKVYLARGSTDIGYVDKSGDLILGPFQDGGKFSGGVAPIMKDGLWSLINKEGRSRSNSKFLTIRESGEGLFVAANEKGEGYIDAASNSVIEFRFKRAFSFSHGLAPVCI